MNQTATNIIQIPQENQFKVVKFELTPEAIIEMVKEYNTLAVIPGDKESYQTVHQAKMVCVKARTGTDKRRKELGSDARQWITDVNSKAQELIAPLLPLEEKLKAMLEEEDQREEKIKAEAAAKIAVLMSDLDHHIERGQVYNLSAETVTNCLDALEAFEISAVDFDTETERGEALKAEGIETLERILADRIKWESDQAEAAKLAEANAAAAKKLADDQAAFKAEQAKAAAEQKKKDDTAALIAAQEAEKTRKANEKLKVEQLALDKEKAKILSDKLAAEEKAYTAMWDEAHAMNLERKIAWATDIARDYYSDDWDAAHEFNAMYDAGFVRAQEIDKAIEKEKLKADKTRAKLVAADKERAHAIRRYFSGMMGNYPEVLFETNEPIQHLIELTEGIENLIEQYESKTEAHV